MLGLIAGAFVWGVIWYPYRLLEREGLTGATATFVTYLIAVLIGVVLYPRTLVGLVRSGGWLVALALVAGWTNYAYVQGMLTGEVMRILLLFYTAPLWTVPLARLLLGERPTFAGYAVVATAVAGTLVMLWRPELGMPFPKNQAEWLGLSAGMGFALNNVISRRLGDIPVAQRAMAGWAGSLVVAGLAILITSHRGADWVQHAFGQWPLVVAIGVVLMAVNLAVQHGLTHVPATRAIVILLCELVFGAISAWYLAGEVMSPQEWIGGALIVAASLFSGQIESKPAPA